MTKKKQECCKVTPNFSYVVPVTAVGRLQPLWAPSPSSTQSNTSQWGISFKVTILLPVWLEEIWFNLAFFFSFISLADIRNYLYILELQNWHRITISKNHLDYIVNAGGTFFCQKVIQKITFPVTSVISSSPLCAEWSKPAATISGLFNVPVALRFAYKVTHGKEK